MYGKFANLYHTYVNTELKKKTNFVFKNTKLYFENIA